MAVTQGRASKLIRPFGYFSADLEQLADWRHSHNVKSIMMHSTTYYRIPVYHLLEMRGSEVSLVSPRENRDPPGRKSDVRARLWLLNLHTYGMPRPSFRPTEHIRALRAYWRARGGYLLQTATAVHPWRNALAEMNPRRTTVLSDSGGVTGLGRIRTILAGESPPSGSEPPQVRERQRRVDRPQSGTYLEDRSTRQTEQEDGRGAIGSTATAGAGPQEERRARKSEAKHEPVFGMEALR